MILELFDFKYLVILMSFNLNNNIILSSKTLIYVMITIFFVKQYLIFQEKNQTLLYKFLLLIL